MRLFGRECSNRVRRSAYSSHSAISLCLTHLMPHSSELSYPTALVRKRVYMNAASAPSLEAGSRKRDVKPIAFVVDDDVSVRESLELLISFAGWQPETFASAEEFLARPRALAPSCLVLDVSLPDLNGLDLQNRIATERSEVPIIFIT